ncbi:hypothetical protein FQR65_LT08988 [Abscondita terminalis]|nr:hypothetical protein FQR65_LT08988 [Abscondita terminalis]
MENLLSAVTYGERIRLLSFVRFPGEAEAQAVENGDGRQHHYSKAEVGRGIDLISDLKAEMKYGRFQNFCRINSTDFEWILNEIGPKIAKEDTEFTEAIPPTERLMLTHSIYRKI